MKSISIKPMRVQRLRKKGFKLQNASRSGLPVIYVGRPTKWGNPFKVNGYTNAWGKAFIAIQLGKTLDGVRDIYKSRIFDNKITFKQSLEWYKIWIAFRIDNNHFDIEELRGKDLACFCPLDTPCHADILIKLVNDVL